MNVSAMSPAHAGILFYTIWQVLQLFLWELLTDETQPTIFAKKEAIIRHLTWIFLHFVILWINTRLREEEKHFKQNKTNLRGVMRLYKWGRRLLK